MLLSLGAGEGGLAAAADPPRVTYRLEAVANLQEAASRLKHYEQELPRTGRQRCPLLAQLARLCFILGQYGDQSKSKEFFTKGQKYAQILVEEQPRRAEGHFWLALNLAGMAGLEPPRQALKTLPAILRELDKAQKLDAGYAQAGAHRVLGRIYCQAPPWPMSVGDLRKSREHLEAAVKIAPENSTNHLFLGETLFELGEAKLARRELERALAVRGNAVGPLGLQGDREEARKKLRDYR